MAKRPNIHTETHRQLIAAILEDYPGAQAKGFNQALRKLLASYDLDESDAMLLDSPHFRPDAYRINADKKRIEVFEVEVTSLLTPTKIVDLGMWWFYWDCEMEEWEPVLILVDRYGHRQEIDLRHAYYRDGPFEGRAPAYGSVRKEAA